MDDVLSILKEYGRSNPDVKGIVLFGSSLYKSNPNDLDYLLIMSDKTSPRLDELHSLMREKAGIVPDCSLMFESEVRELYDKDFLLYEILNNGKTIYGDSFINKLKGGKIDPSAATTNMLKTRSDDLRSLKKNILENLSVTLSIGHYNFLFKKTGKVIPYSKIEEVLKDYGINYSTQKKLWNLLKHNNDISFQDIDSLQKEIESELSDLK